MKKEIPVRTTSGRPPESQDPVVLTLLRLCAESILAHPEAVPPDLYSLCDTWADHLAGILGEHGGPLMAIQPPGRAVRPLSSGTSRRARR